MTKTELLTAIEADPNTIEIAGEEPHTGHTYVRVRYWVNQAENIAKEESFNIYIKDEGLPTEEAYFEKKPYYMIATPQFRIDVEAKIAAVQTATGDPKFWHFESINNDEEKAIVVGFWLVAGKLVERKYGAYRKADTTIDFIEVG